MDNMTNGKKKNTVLVVDDNLINRKVLTMIVSESYNCLEATNGQEALDVLEKNQDKILAIMLDIVMPLMDGYEFLKAIKNREEYKNIPIIVTTGNDSEENEVKALELGAWDFVSKPYEATIISFRLENAVKRSKLLETEKLSYALTYDEVTGLFNRQNFFIESKKLIDIYTKNDFAIYVIDIDKFKYINFNTDDGDRVIEIFVNALRYIMSRVPCRAIGRMNTETFAICFSEVFLDADTFINSLAEKVNKSLGDYNIEISLGINKIEKDFENIESEYQKAVFAVDQCKANPYLKYSYYDKYLHQELKRDTQLLKTIYNDFENGSFAVEYLPQYCTKDKKMSGAAAVAIWNNEEYGKIYPKEYLKLVRNDFVAQLDAFVVNEVCELVSSGDLNDMPITIKLSNYTVHSTELIDRILDVVDEYDIDHSKICFDISEKVFDIQEEDAKDSIMKLIVKNFDIQISDLGKGKSTLDALSSVIISKIIIEPSFIFNSKDVALGKSVYDIMVNFAKSHDVDLVIESKDFDKDVLGSGSNIHLLKSEIDSLVSGDEIIKMSK